MLNSKYILFLAHIFLAPLSIPFVYVIVSLENY